MAKGDKQLPAGINLPFRGLTRQLIITPNYLFCLSQKGSRSATLGINGRPLSLAGAEQERGTTFRAVLRFPPPGFMFSTDHFGERCRTFYREIGLLLTGFCHLQVVKGFKTVCGERSWALCFLKSNGPFRSKAARKAGIFLLQICNSVFSLGRPFASLLWEGRLELLGLLFRLHFLKV